MQNDVILSIDIGIHNLGYAIYDKNTRNEHKTESLLFDLYNLDENIEKKDKKKYSHHKLHYSNSGFQT